MSVSIRLIEAGDEVASRGGLSDRAYGRARYKVRLTKFDLNQIWKPLQIQINIL